MNQISRKVLCVDDDANVLAGMYRQFRRELELSVASSGKEGLETIAASGPFAVVIADYKMPYMNGVDFLRQVHAASPETATLMLTGQSELDVAVGALHEGHIFRFLRKPCPTDVLRHAIEDGLEQYRLIVSERQLSRELANANGQLRTMNECLEQMVNERTATIRRMHKFVTELNGLETLEEVGQSVVETVAQMLNSTTVALLVPENGREYLNVLAAVGIPKDLAASARIPIGRGVAGRVFATNESLVINSREELPDVDESALSEYLASVPMLAVLLVTPTGAVGVMNVTGHHDSEPYGDEDLANVRAICENASIALCNQIRLAERNEARDAIILAMAKLAEQRDPETGLHLERVRAYCRLLGTALARKPGFGEITRAFIESLYRSSPLHDIGKVGIPDNVLLKPGKLTPEEFEIMKRHTMIGGDTIFALIDKGSSQDFLQLAMEIAYHHHEKFNGSGYPFGLAGRDIPLSARIMAVADVYDALTSRRVYKAAFPHEKAVSIIQKDAGTHFDPDIVATFMEIHDQFATLASELADHLPESDAAPATTDQPSPKTEAPVAV
jgi:response regulator RpfG family c-di-GMP phosphodiesterase